MGNSAAFAQAVTGKTATVNLSGTVPSSLTMTVTPITANTSALPLTPGTSTTSTYIKIATITSASTNSAGGLKVNVTSSWLLESAGKTPIPITQFAEGPISSSIPWSGGPVSIYATKPLDYTYSVAAGPADDQSVYIGYSVPANQAPGLYTGSITFTATDN